MARRIIHGHAVNGVKSRVYAVWQHMLRRCYTPEFKQFKDYGGRGITVCPEWREDFPAFLRDMGTPPAGHQIDRIDNDGPYSPENCRWVDRKTQIRNRRITLKVEYQGELRPLAELADAAGLPYRIVLGRLRSGWEIDRILSTPKSQKHVRSKDQCAKSALIAKMRHAAIRQAKAEGRDLTDEELNQARKAAVAALARL